MAHDEAGFGVDAFCQEHSGGVELGLRGTGDDDRDRLPRLRRAVHFTADTKNHYHCTPRSMAAIANIAVGAARRKRSARKNPRSLVICLLLSTATFTMQNEP
jgi:hypothetical protein